MNIENAKTLVGQLKRLPDEKFWMPDLMKHRECGTVACIAGWASILNGGPTEITDDESREIIWRFSREWLGIEDWEATDLFEGFWIEKDSEDITRKDAINYLERLIGAAS